MCGKRSLPMAFDESGLLPWPRNEKSVGHAVPLQTEVAREPTDFWKSVLAAASYVETSGWGSIVRYWKAPVAEPALIKLCVLGTGPKTFIVQNAVSKVALRGSEPSKCMDTESKGVGDQSCRGRPPFSCAGPQEALRVAQLCRDVADVVDGGPSPRSGTSLRGHLQTSAADTSCNQLPLNRSLEPPRKKACLLRGALAHGDVHPEGHVQPLAADNGAAPNARNPLEPAQKKLRSSQAGTFESPTSSLQLAGKTQVSAADLARSLHIGRLKRDSGFREDALLKSIAVLRVGATYSDGEHVVRRTDEYHGTPKRRRLTQLRRGVRQPCNLRWRTSAAPLRRAPCDLQGFAGGVRLEMQTRSDDAQHALRPQRVIQCTP